MHVTDTFFDQPAGQQAAVGVRRGSILLAHGGRLLADIERIERGELHAVGGFHGLNAAFEKCVGPKRRHVVAVEILDEVELQPLAFGVELLVPQVADHFFRVHFGLVEMRALMLRGQEARAPQALTSG